jgi:hypothetical protein
MINKSNNIFHHTTSTTRLVGIGTPTIVDKIMKICQNIKNLFMNFVWTLNYKEYESNRDEKS